MFAVGANLKAADAGMDDEREFHIHPLEDTLNEVAEEKPIPTLTARLVLRDEFNPILVALGDDMRAAKFFLQQILQRLAEGPMSPEENEKFKTIAQAIDDRLSFIGQLIIDKLALLSELKGSDETPEDNSLEKTIARGVSTALLGPPA